MKKEETLKAILNCAKIYRLNLENKNFMFVFNSPNNPIDYFEAVFLPRNFHHLTGVKIINKNIKSSVDFYNLCTSNNLSCNDFKLSADGTTELKLAVLPQLMQIHRTAKIIGDYSDVKVNLQTEKLAGSIIACLGFVSEGNYYIPNTALKEDIRNITQSPQKAIIAIYSKSIHENKYTRLRHLRKGFTLETLVLPDKVSSKIDLSKLESDFKRASP